MSLSFLIFGSYLSLGIPKFLFKVIFVAVILSTHSYLEFICVGCYCYRFFFVFRNGTSDFAKAGQVSDDTITLINY